MYAMAWLGTYGVDLNAVCHKALSSSCYISACQTKSQSDTASACAWAEPDAAGVFCCVRFSAEQHEQLHQSQLAGCAIKSAEWGHTTRWAGVVVGCGVAVIGTWHGMQPAEHHLDIPVLQGTTIV